MDGLKVPAPLSRCFCGSGTAWALQLCGVLSVDVCRLLWELHFNSALTRVLGKTPANYEVDRMNGCWENYRTERWQRVFSFESPHHKNTNMISALSASFLVSRFEYAVNVGIVCSLNDKCLLWNQTWKHSISLAWMASLDFFQKLTRLHCLLGPFRTHIIRFITLFVCSEPVASLKALHTEVFWSELSALNNLRNGFLCMDGINIWPNYCRLGH